MKLLKISPLSALQKYLTFIFSLIFFIGWHSETLCSQPMESRQINSGHDDISFPERIIDLNGSWEFKATEETEWMPAVVPSTVHSDLLRAGRLPDPFYRDNELKVQWVEKKEWEYRRFFNIEKSYLNHDKIILELSCVNY
jgi:beta-galactosidase/beta-glucuronidase